MDKVTLQRKSAKKLSSIKCSLSLTLCVLKLLKHMINLESSGNDKSIVIEFFIEQNKHNKKASVSVHHSRKHIKVL